MTIGNTKANEIPKVTPDDVCPFIHYIDNELCTNESSHFATKEVVKNTVFYHSRHEQKFDPKQLCPLFSYLNKTYCSSSETVNFVSHVDADIANRIKIIKHIFESIESNNINDTNNVCCCILDKVI
jgi:pyruvate/2-oxoacid:ferredoxin oxidoreductase alpha subunit